MSLGERIQYYRKRDGLSQEQLAGALGVSRQAVSKWELNDAQPELDKVLAMARLFHVSTDALLGNEAPEGGAVPPIHTATARRIRRLPWYLLGLIPLGAGAYLLVEGLFTLLTLYRLMQMVGMP